MNIDSENQINSDMITNGFFKMKSIMFQCYLTTARFSKNIRHVITLEIE